MNKVFGGVLLAMGILVAGASGLCSLAVLFSSGEFAGGGMWPAVLLFGGIPFAAGAGMVYGGLRLIRESRREREETADQVAKTFE